MSFADQNHRCYRRERAALNERNLNPNTHSSQPQRLNKRCDTTSEEISIDQVNELILPQTKRS